MKINIIKYDRGEYTTKDGFYIPSENTVFIERGGTLDNEEALSDWLKTIAM